MGAKNSATVKADKAKVVFNWREQYLEVVSKEDK